MDVRLLYFDISQAITITSCVRSSIQRMVSSPSSFEFGTSFPNKLLRSHRLGQSRSVSAGVGHLRLAEKAFSSNFNDL